MSELSPLSDRWRQLGLALGLDANKIYEIESCNVSPEDCLIEILTLWLKGGYNTGNPSWKLLADAVRHPVGGNNPRLARMIIWKYEGIILSCRCIHTTLARL